jgi:hypothetical protein
MKTTHLFFRWTISILFTHTIKSHAYDRSKPADRIWSRRAPPREEAARHTATQTMFTISASASTRPTVAVNRRAVAAKRSVAVRAGKVRTAF